MPLQDYKCPECGIVHERYVGVNPANWRTIKCDKCLIIVKMERQPPLSARTPDKWGANVH
jgi:hypothetical protein